MTALHLPLYREEVERPFLGVTRSARGLKWLERLPAADAYLATAISQRHGLPELLGRILAARGAALDDVPALLNPTLKEMLPDPATLLDMETGAARLARAIQKQERIAIFGDYDVDGAASAALLKRYLAAHGLDARLYIPDRIVEGYGPNPAAIQALIKEGARLIVTVDCGSTSHDALAAAARLGADVIVVDHHQADEALPPALAVINPNRQDDLSGQGHLAAAGVTFLLLVAATRRLRVQGWYAGKPEPDLLGWLDLVALATVCDVVPIKGVNRAFVAQGVKIMARRQNLGLRELADAAQLKAPPTPYHLGFVLGPRINAGGRIGDAGLGARLLATGDAAQARQIAATLDKLNRERREMELRTLEDALAQAGRALEQEPDRSILMLGSPEWHKGLVGLVASRLTERYQRPALVIAWNADGEEGTGSARSIAGADIGRAVRAAVAGGLLKKGGGHAMAAGVTLDKAKFQEFQAFLESELNGQVSNARRQAGLQIDGALTPQGVTPELYDLVEKAGPYGAGNPSPRFVFPAHRIGFVKRMGEAHIRCALKAADGSQLNAVAFRAAGSPLGDLLLGNAGASLHVAGHLRRDNWGGSERIELMIEDAADPRQQRP